MKRKMNKQDKLFERIKQAAEAQERQSFQRKEAVWDKVSQKLNPKKRKRMILYRTLGAAAVIAVIIFAGFQFTGNQDRLDENTIVNKDININDEPNTELVEDIKDELRKAERLEMKYLDSVEVDTEKTKASKSKAIVSTEADDITEPVYDIVEGDEKIDTSSNAKKKNLVSTSAEVVPSKKPIMALDDIEKNTGAMNNLTTSVQSQSEMSKEKYNIEGVVIDESALPIPGVNIIIKGTTNGTQTNFDGEFNIEVEKGKTLLFAYVGFKFREVEINEQKDLTITMEPNLAELDEVVVTSKEKKGVPPPPLAAEAIIVVEDDSENKILKQLQGQVAGVQVNTNSVQSSRYETKVYDQALFMIAEGPNNESEINIRSKAMVSNHAPLYILDGKTISQEEFISMNPRNIKSVNVVKSKAELFKMGYGKKSKNGIIKISTEKKSNSDIKPDSIVHWYNNHVNYYNNEDYESFQENPFTSPLSEPLSTFSIDVDRAAYTNIRRFINNGQEVPKDAVRIEEMLNFFEYDYDKPRDKHPFAIHTAYSDAPWNTNHKLLRIALQGKDIPISELPASNLVFLIDVSGSMSNQNKLPLVKKSLNLLVDQMRSKDKIALVTYAGNSEVVLEPTSGKQKTKIKNAINRLSSGGGTYASQGIETAYALAEENFVKDGNNRVIIATDGDFNIGVTQNQSLEDLIAKKRKTNIFLTCLGYGMGNYKDSKMQSLSQKGNGNYAYIDTYQEAQKFLEREFKGSLYAIAKDVKIQIEFNPKHVDSYRLIGYETRLLEDRDFADDTKDAGEIGVNHQVTALYEVIPRGVESRFGEFNPKLKYQKAEQPDFNLYSNELATVKFRYKPPASDKSIKLERVIKNESVRLNKTSGDFKFATAVAWFGLKLRESQLISKSDKEDIINLAKQGLDNDKEGYRAEFIRLVRLYE
jgi:Ca-activated chloride channel family protein